MAFPAFSLMAGRLLQEANFAHYGAELKGKQPVGMKDVRRSPVAP